MQTSPTIEQLVARHPQRPVPGVDEVAARSELERLTIQSSTVPRSDIVDDIATTMPLSAVRLVARSRFTLRIPTDQGALRGPVQRRRLYGPHVAMRISELKPNVTGVMNGDLSDIAVDAGLPAPVRRTTLLHEIGHLLSVQLGTATHPLSQSKEWLEIFVLTKDFSTNYGATSADEYFAECVALYLTTFADQTTSGVPFVTTREEFARANPSAHAYMVNLFEKVIPAASARSARALAVEHLQRHVNKAVGDETETLIDKAIAQLGLARLGVPNGRAELRFTLNRLHKQLDWWRNPFADRNAGHVATLEAFEREYTTLKPAT